MRRCPPHAPQVFTVSDRRMARALIGRGFFGFWVSVLVAIPRRDLTRAVGAVTELDADTVSKAAREPGIWDWEGHYGSIVCAPSDQPVSPNDF